MRKPNGPLVKAAALASAITIVSQIAAAALRGVYPFGTNNHNLNDLWAQLIPFHAQLRRLLTGQGISDWQFNWNSGLGVGWLPDYATYASSPFALLAAVFPADRMDLALWVIIMVKMAVAAAAMTWYLQLIRPHGPWPLLGLLGASYALCGWAIDDASYIPMWLDGLIALPLLAMVGEWAIRGRRFLVSVLIVGLSWWANYYTAYMATIGAVLFTVLRMVADRVGLRPAALGMLRFATRGVLGVAGAGVLLLPTFLAVRAGVPGATVSATPVAPGTFAARLLPGTEWVGSTPGLSTLGVALVLALSLPFLPGVAARVRISYSVGAVLLAASMLFTPTMLAWHLFVIPNGSPYRQAFVLCGLLIVCAWLSVGGLTTRVSMWSLWGGLGAVALLWLLSRRTDPTPVTSWLTTVSPLIWAGVLTVWTLWRMRPGLPRPHLLAWACVVLTTLEAIMATVVTHDLQTRILPPVPNTSSPAMRETIAQLEAWPDPSAQWPARRVLEPPDLNPNSGPLLGIAGLGYYSSTVSAEMSQAVRELGSPWSRYGRAVGGNVDSGLAALLGFQSSLSLHMAAGDITVSKNSAGSFPVLRVLRPGSEGSVRRSTILNRNRLFDRPPYRTPAFWAGNDQSTPTEVTKAVVVTSDTVDLRTTCAPGTTVLFEAPAGLYSVRSGGTEVRVDSRQRDYLSWGVLDLGPAPANGAVTITLTDIHGIVVRPSLIGCLDAASQAAQIRGGNPPDAVQIQGRTIAARWSKRVTGDVLISTATTTGWTCRVDGRPARITRRAGLMTIPVSNATRLACSYMTPGLKSGALISGGAGLLTLAIAAWGLLARRRRSTLPADGSGEHTS